MSILHKIFKKKGPQDEKSKGKTCSSCSAINPLDVKFCSFCGGEFRVVSDTFDAFISYRRESGSDLASLLKIQLEDRFHKTIFLDVNELQVGRFDEALLNRIEKTPNFIVILSRASLDRCANKSDWLKREVMQAFKTGRNIIPVLAEGFTYPTDEIWALLPTEMRVLPSLNGVNYSHIHQDSAIRKIASYMKTQKEISGRQVIPPPKENDDHSDKNKSEYSILNKIPKDNPISVPKEVPINKNQDTEVLIGVPKLISKSVETPVHNSIRLGSIKIVSLSNNTERDNLAKIGEIRINEL